jgi:hypothetical protein
MNVGLNRLRRFENVASNTSFRRLPGLVADGFAALEPNSCFLLKIGSSRGRPAIVKGSFEFVVFSFQDVRQQGIENLKLINWI